MKFDVSICKNCFFFADPWCEAEYYKKAVDAYISCPTHIEKTKGQMNIEDLLGDADNDVR